MLSKRYIVVLSLGVWIVGCRQDMHDQPKYQPYEASDFFQDGIASRFSPEGTVARGELQDNEPLYLGKEKGEFISYFPLEIDKGALERGRERYDIFCSPCHDRAGNGRGMIVQRGFKQPPSLHSDRIRDALPGYLYDVITNGFGSMYSYKERIPVEDRWKIVAYIRALQLSQRASIDVLSASDKEKLEGTR